MTDRALLSRCIRRLEDQQDRLAIGGVMKMLHRAELRDVLFQQRLVLFL
jgi:hypothetical protein